MNVKIKKSILKQLIKLAVYKMGPGGLMLLVDPRLLKHLKSQGKRKQVHLYLPLNILRPRGPLRKLSLSRHILLMLKDTWQSWVDLKYGDSILLNKLLKLIQKNLQLLMNYRWSRFNKQLLK